MMKKASSVVPIVAILLEESTHNKSLKPTLTHVTPFAERANSAPRYGGLVPPLNGQEKILANNGI